MERKIYKTIRAGIFFIFSVFISQTDFAQAPTCESIVPYYQVNLTGHPDSIWYSPGIIRDGNCCGAVGNRCTSFDVTLDPNAAMINFNIASGAIPSGSMFYQVDCGPQVAVGQPICISGAGVHHVTFCKPGNNQNTYVIQSIPKPIFPKTQFVRIGCHQNIKVLGMDTTSVTWTSTYPGSPGQYNSYLSCTNGCINPLYTPATNAPAYIIYKICGTPLANLCGYNYACDTFRIYNKPVLTASVTPNPAGFCANGPGITLTVTASGGYGAYTYIWRDQSNITVGTGSTYQATNAGIFSVEVRDALYNTSSCPSVFVSVPVAITNAPVVNAGPDQTLCATNATAYLNGTSQYANGIIWSGGAGTFNPNSTNLNASYTPTAAEIASGSVTLILSSTGTGGGCTNVSDNIILHYPPTLIVSLPNVNVPCNNSTTNLIPNITGGTAPFSYVWNTGSNSSSILVGQGNFCVGVTDNIGCIANACANVIAPPALSLTMSSTIVSVNGGSDGTATANPGGGTPPYNYSWSPGGQSTQTAVGLSYGIYTATITDSKGCSIYSSIVVNEPRCASFNGTMIKNNILCFGSMNGSATANVSGGTGPYTYNWNDALNQSTATASGLGAGTYMVVVSDANGCLYSSSVVISEPTQLNNVMNQVNVTTNGGSNGSATANPSGGTPGYTYNWSNGGTTQTISSLTPGMYILTLKDNNNCSLIDSVMIQGVSCQNLIVSYNVINVSCRGGNNGSATVIALHGTSPYSYLWNTGATTATINNLSAGTYVVKVTDASNCVTFKNVIVNEPSPLSIVLAPTPISCYNKNDGTIDLTVSGGTFPYTFNWSNGITAEDLINLSSGTYSVSVTDSKGCITNGSTNIIRPGQLTVGSTYTNVTCNGGNNGAINLNVTGGILPYSFNWNNGNTSQNLSGLSSGQYSVVVTDANGCKINTPLGILVDQPNPVAVLSHTVSCAAPGSGVASVSVTPNGGWQSPYQVSFDNGITWLSAGTYNAMLPVNATYTVLIKDNNNCLSPTPDIIHINPEPTVNAVSYNKCFYGTTSSSPVNVSVGGGTGGPYSVSFNGGSTFGAPGNYSSSMPIGNTYTVEVKDGNGCVSLTTPITIPAVLASTSTLSLYNGYNISCNGMHDGNINTATIGGTSPYAYAWSNASTVQNQSGLNAGTYNVIIKDANNCADTLNFVLTQPQLLSSSLNSTGNFNGYDIPCNGMNTAGINLSVNGGVTSYNYQWSNGSTNQNLSSLTAGTYSVVITDANNCKTNAQITLTQPAILSSAITAGSNFNGYNISCYGLNDGAINLSVSGGVQNYNYNWSNGSNAQNLSSLAAGTYQVVVTDQNNCTNTLLISLTQPSDLISSVVSLSNYNGYNVTCHGQSNGSIDINVNGGVSAYIYNWSNGTSTQDQSGIVAGTYSVLIADANNCKDTLNFVLSEPAQLSSTINATTNYNGYQISCNGLSDGAINFTVNGGASFYSYQWSNGSVTQNISGLPAGIYSVVATDTNHCTVTSQIILAEPAALTSSITATTNYNGYNISCYGLSDGSLNLQVNGGVQNYNYSWSNGGSSQNLSSLPAGTYQVVVTDQNNCSGTASVTLTQPSDMISSVVSLSNYNGYNISCKGLSDGNIDINVSGGVVSYGYAWSNGTISQDQSTIGAGAYSVIITDANNCKDTLSVVLTEPAVLGSNVIATTNYNGYQISCNGLSDGGINHTVIGGVAAYSYQWSNGSATQNISGLPAGTYSVMVTDANNCTAISQVTLTEPADITSSITVGSNYNGYSISCFGLNDGSAYLQVAGGVPTYNYSWSNGSSSQNLSSIPAGNYQVVVTDKNNCKDSVNVTLTQPSDLVSTVVSLSNYNGYNISCAGLTNGTVDINVHGGVAAYTYVWSNGTSTQDQSNIGAGTYSVVISDLNNCKDTLHIILNAPAPLISTGIIASDYNGYSVSCYGSTNGSINVQTTGGVADYFYAWSNGISTQNQINIGADTYGVVVSDQNGCADTLQFTLTQPDSISSTATVQNILCNSFHNGSVDQAINGGVSPFVYNWSNGTNNQDLLAVGNGTYSVTITDMNGCSLIKSYTITETSPIVNNLSHTDVTCYGQQNGNIIANVSGGTPVYTYLWSNGSTQSQLSNMGPGVYSLTITDANNCVRTDSVTISSPSVVLGSVNSPLFNNGHNISFPNLSDGSITSTVSGGTIPYAYNWSNGATSQNLSNLPAGTYTLQVTDNNGCVFKTTVTLTAPLELAMPSGISPNGDGLNDFFVVHGLENYPNNNISIFNRWGNIVFEKEKYTNAWAGKSNAGADLPDGTYFVILKINSGDIVLTGYVDIRR